MSKQKLILRVLLGSLAVAAVAGAAAVFMQGTRFGWKVTVTGIFTAVAALLLLPISKMSDQERTRAAGTAGIVWVVVEYLLAVAAVFTGGDKIAILALSLALPGLAMVVAIRLRAAAGHRAGSIVLLLTGTIAMVLFAVAVGLPGRFYEHDNWWGTGWSAFLFGVMAAASLMGSGRPGLVFRLVGAVANLIGGAMLIHHIWKGSGGGEAIFSMVVAFGAVPAHANLCLLVPLKPGQRWLAWGTIAAGAATAALVVLCVWNNVNDWDPLMRLAGASGVFAGCGSLALLVMARLNRGIDVEPGSASMELVDITVICPRCQKKQTTALGGSHCVDCGLRFNITVEEPRCPGCGYLLYKLTGTSCPECGATLGKG